MTSTTVPPTLPTIRATANASPRQRQSCACKAFQDVWTTCSVLCRPRPDHIARHLYGGRGFRALCRGAVQWMASHLHRASAWPELSGGKRVLDVFRQRSTSYALFTHHVFALTDRLSLTGGLRYTHENKAFDATLASDTPGCASAVSIHGPTLAAVPPNLRGLICIPNLDPRYDGFYETERDGGDWSGTAALSNRFSESWDALFQLQPRLQGWRFPVRPFGHESAGAISRRSSRSTRRLPIPSRAAIKGLAPDGTWRLSTAVFHTKFSDYQFSWFTGLNRRTTNVPELVREAWNWRQAYRPGDLAFSFSGIYQEVRSAIQVFRPGSLRCRGRRRLSRHAGFSSERPAMSARSERSA